MRYFLGSVQELRSQAIEITLFPRIESEFVMTTPANVLPKLTEITPFEHDENDFEFTNNITLTDPSFLRESEIDIILGAAEYAQAIQSGLVKSDKEP